jgi:hypothetical protein
MARGKAREQRRRSLKAAYFQQATRKLGFGKSFAFVLCGEQKGAAYDDQSNQVVSKSDDLQCSELIRRVDGGVCARSGHGRAAKPTGCGPGAEPATHDAGMASILSPTPASSATAGARAAG